MAVDRSLIERLESLAAMSTEPSLIVLAVKMFDLPGAIDACTAWPGATILTIQNGIGLRTRSSPGGRRSARSPDR
jgi:hypothetical protein